MKKLMIVLIGSLLSINLLAQGEAGTDKLRAAFETSYIYEKAEQYTKAVELLSQNYDSSSYACNLRLGYLNYLQAAHSNAIVFYKKAIQLQPKSIEARLGCALPLSTQNQWNEVKTIYAEILAIDPNHTLTNYRMGLILYNQADYKSALPYFEAASALYPFDFDLSLMLAWCELKLQKYAEARTQFNHTLLISPNNASALEGLKMSQVK